MWIEIAYLGRNQHRDLVTPLAGVWIEIVTTGTYAKKMHVTPLAGVWIEITLLETNVVTLSRHSPCGSVD